MQLCSFLKIKRISNMKKEIVAFGFAVASSAALAAIEMGAPFSDGAVLQRGMKVPVWGTATAGNEIEVSFAGKSLETTVSQDGSWRVDLPSMDACSKGREMVVVERESGWFGSKVDEKVLTDILVGEVWFASGQSNMETPIWHDGNSRYRDGKGAMMTAMTKLPLVRFIKTPRVYGTASRQKLKVQWQKFEPSSFVATHYSCHWKLLSAVAWYYARELHLALGIPIGIVESSIGGTGIDAWTPREGYEGCDPSINSVAEYKPLFGKEWKRNDLYNAPFQQPTSLFNAMVRDYTPMAMRGFIWYQGCNNNPESHLYRVKMHALYNGWAKAFENPSLKLYFAQLAPWQTNWMGICMAQTQFAAEQPNAAIAVTADVGNFDDIHPNDKETVAQRLVIHALKRDYGFDIPEDDSPVAKSLSVAGDVATVEFDNATFWYIYNLDMSLKAPFEIAGEDGVWKQAEIVVCKDCEKGWKALSFINHSALHLKSAEVKSPVAVRYLGRDRTSGVMYNQVALPLGPFEISLGAKKTK
jgi:sialate O-acetylesterase